MTMLRDALLVAGGGALGCLARWAVSLWLARPGFPWPTLAVNLLGSFLIGALLAGRLAEEPAIAWRLLLVTGFLGGFTTMSAFAYETTALVDAAPWRAAGYVALTIAGALLAAFAGRALVRALA